MFAGFAGDKDALERAAALRPDSGTRAARAPVLFAYANSVQRFDKQLADRPTRTRDR